MKGRVVLITTAMLCWAAAAAAQSGDSASFRARVESERRVFLVTNAGVYAGFGGGSILGIADLGAMANLSPRHGVGASWFIAVGENGLYTGPVLRWRRWLGPTRSIDVALGTPISGGWEIRPGSALGLVKYNLSPNFGIAARPELVRYRNEYVCDAAGCRPVSDTRARLYLGAELGGKPGKVLGGGAAIVLIVGAVAIAASGGILD